MNDELRFDRRMTRLRQQHDLQNLASFMHSCNPITYYLHWGNYQTRKLVFPETHHDIITGSWHLSKVSSINNSLINQLGRTTHMLYESIASILLSKQNQIRDRLKFILQAPFLDKSHTLPAKITMDVDTDLQDFQKFIKTGSHRKLKLMRRRIDRRKWVDGKFCCQNNCLINLRSVIISSHIDIGYKIQAACAGIWTEKKGTYWQSRYIVIKTRQWILYASFSYCVVIYKFFFTSEWRSHRLRINET